MAVPGSLDQPCFGCFGLVQSHQKKKDIQKDLSRTDRENFITIAKRKANLHSSPVRLAGKLSGSTVKCLILLNLREYNAKYSYLIIVLLVCCPSKNFFQFSSSNFPAGYILRGAEMTGHKLTLCLKDGLSWDKTLALPFRHIACITQGRLLAIIYMAGFVWFDSQINLSNCRL